MYYQNVFEFKYVSENLNNTSFDFNKMWKSQINSKILY